MNTEDKCERRFMVVSDWNPITQAVLLEKLRLEGIDIAIDFGGLKGDRSVHTLEGGTLLIDDPLEPLAGWDPTHSMKTSKRDNVYPPIARKPVQTYNTETVHTGPETRQQRRKRERMEGKRSKL
jgi:hypothetical protein